MKPLLRNNVFIKFIFRFIVSFLAFYMLLQFIQPEFNSAFAHIGNWLCGISINSNREIGRVAGIIIKEEANGNTFLSVGTANSANVRPGGKVDLKAKKVNFNTFAYLPLIFLLALIEISPVKLKRKLLSYLLSIITIFLFMFFKLWILVLVANNFDIARAKGISETIIGLDWWLYNVLIGQTSLGTAMIAAIIIWILFTFNTKDYENIKKMIANIKTSNN